MKQEVRKDHEEESEKKKRRIRRRRSHIQWPTSSNLHTHTMNTDAKELVDLCTPNMDITENVDDPVEKKYEAVAITSTISFERISNLDQRLSILPLYPTSDSQNQEKYPLLPNMSPYQLTDIELARRYSGVFKPACDILNNNPTIPSFLREKYELFYGNLLRRLKVDLAILDYNYTRLNQYIKMLNYEIIRVFNLQSDEIQFIEEKEYPLALEFFLQFDIHMFYMKTCTFRFARPRSMNEGLFCLQVPEARYELAACGNCGLCYPQYDMTYRTKKSVVEFSQAHKHIFVNGYQTILNCSATCHTRNLIYALTCPCGKVDYIGATTQSFHGRLKKHREHGNRIMHEFLLGQENIIRDLPRPKSTEILRKDRMKLYQHSVRCPVAMQIFLDANPQYWRFVPMSIEESKRPEQQTIQHPNLVDELDFHLRSKEDSFICVEAIPKPPTGYTFSNRQLLLQTQYFHKKRDQILPNQDIDLYNATIVAVLPETCSDMFRNIIESLFITYAETHLNTFGHVLTGDQQSHIYPLNNPWLARGDEWCQELLRRPQPKKSNFN